MAKDLNNSVEQNSPNINDDNEKSLVGKFKSIISNTPLSKWFRKHDDSPRSTIRRRDEENDDDIIQMQPPAKRKKLPNNNDGNSVSGLLINSSDNISVTVSKVTLNHYQEPVAGPSGLKSRKFLNNVNTPISGKTVFISDISNGHKDSDSEESTSGYSSVARIGSKEQVSQSETSSKQPSPLQTNSPPESRSLFQSPGVISNRSLFADRTGSPNLNTSMSSRRPSFNVTTFGSPNLMDKTISTEKIIHSPFYNGSTIYGGASAYGRKVSRNAKDLRAALKKSVHFKPINKPKTNVVLGKTAKKILETIEQYSTPVNDAKKIPVPSKRFRFDTSLIGKHVGANPFSAQTSTASNNELQVPSVCDLLKMKQKAKLQTSTEAVRQIATASKSTLNVETPTKKLNSEPPQKLNNTDIKKDTSIAFFTLSENDTPKTSTEQNISKVSLQKEVNLTPKHEGSKATSSLPFTNFLKNIPKKPDSSPTLPKVNPTTTAKNPEKIQKQAIVTENHTSTTKNTTCIKPQSHAEPARKIQNELQFTPHFKFSDPLIISENLKSIVALNDFKFSEPLSQMFKTDQSSNLIVPTTKLIKDKNNGQNITGDAFLNSNSTLLNKFKPAAGPWECSTCLVRNKADANKCAACETPSPSSSLMDKFKPSAGTWECNTCLIRNKSEATKCVACETPKPNSKSLPKQANKPFEASVSSFGAAFKKPDGMWECPVCMIRNPNYIPKCAACETANPKPSLLVLSSSSDSGFPDKFKMPANTWECLTCLIRNKQENSKCDACETPRSTNTSTNQLSSPSKMKDDEWECKVCMAQNKSIHGKCHCCDAIKPSPNFVKQAVEFKPPAPKFNFGIDPKIVAGFKFGIPPALNQPTVPTSSTEVKTVNNENSSSATVTLPSFSFGDKATEKDKTEDIAKSPPSTAVSSVTTPILSVSSNSCKPFVPDQAKTIATTLSLSSASTSTVSTSVLTSVSTSQTISKPLFNFSGKPDEVKSNTTATSVIPKFEFPKTTNTVKAVSIQSSVSAASAPVFSLGNNAKPVDSTSSPIFGQNKLTSFNNSSNVKSSSSFESPAKAMKLFPSKKDDSSEPPAKAPMLSFNPTAAPLANPPAAPSAGFNFGSAAKTTPSFNFTAAQKDKSAIDGSSGTMFGGSTGNNGNAVFTFGAASQNTATQKTGFNFGAPQAPSYSGFNFNASATPGLAVPTAGTTGGFSFSASAENAKPSFNFSNNPSFSFQATSENSGTIGQRKIKKAVRRGR